MVVLKNLISKLGLLVVTTFFLFAIAIYTKEKKEKLIRAINSSIFETWAFKENFTDFYSLKVNYGAIISALEEGDRTNNRIEKLINKAMKGENITTLIYGGSSTKGADLGIRNRQSTFHFAFYKWWNDVITPLTRSHLKREVLAVGGVGSTYFGHCWREYLNKDESVDLVLWEFNINDPDSDDYGKGVEKFVRTVLLYDSHPALVFVKFFLKTEFPFAVGHQLYCPLDGFKRDLLKSLAQYYSFSSIDLLSVTCSYMKNSTHPKVKVQEMFNHLHPSALAHAQLGYLLILYFQTKFIRYLGSNALQYYTGKKISHNKHITNDMEEGELPRPLFNASDIKSTCWSAVVPDYRFRMPHHLFRLNLSHFYGYTPIRFPIWNVALGDRKDLRGGYRFHNKRNISLYFHIDCPNPKSVYIALTHLVDGGITQFKLRDSYNARGEMIINCSRVVHPATHVYYLGTFSPGETELSVATISGGCQLSAIITE